MRLQMGGSQETKQMVMYCVEFFVGQVRYVYQSLDINKPLLHKLVGVVSKSLGEVFPEVSQRQKHIELLIRNEEESFLRTLEKGIKRFDELAEKYKKKKKIPGAEAFDLYSTYGFPRDLIELMSRENRYSVSDKEWNAGRGETQSDG